MTHIAFEHLLGHLPLQHHEYAEERGLPLHFRSVVYGVRATRRQVSKGMEAHFTHDQETIGDVISGCHWPTAGEDKRPIGAWRFGAWPAELALPDTRVETPISGGVVSERRGAMSFPIFNIAWEADERFMPLEVSTHPDLPRTPGGSIGLVLDSTKENRQEPLWFPTDGRLVAQWRGLNPNEFSSVVHDVDEDGFLDKKRLARLDTAWRVSGLLAATGSVPAGTIPSQAQALAWNLTRSPKDDPYGLCYGVSLDFRGRPSTPPAPPRLSGSVGDTWSGLPTGTLRLDRRITGGSAIPSSDEPFIKRGDPALAYAGAERSGPLYVGGKDDKHKHGANADGEPLNSLHLQAAALWYATPEMDASLEFRLENYPGAAIFENTVEVHLAYDPKAVHPWLTEGGALGRVRLLPGLWRWYSYTPFKPCTPGVPVPPIPVPVEPGAGGGGPGGGGQPPGGGGGGQPPGADPAGEQQRQEAALFRRARELHSAMEVAPVGTFNELSAPALSFRPQKPWEPGGDGRYYPRLPGDVSQRLDHAPVTARVEAFGKVLPHCDWDRNRDRSGHRYMALTGGGGLAFLPPELGIEDARGEDTRQSLGTISTTWFGLVQSRLYIAGGISTTLGQPVSGWTWYRDGSNLQFSEIDAAGALDGRLLMRSGDGAEFQTGTLHPIRSTASNTTLTLADHTLLVDCTGGDQTVNLPTAVGNAGLVYQVKKVAGVPANVATLQPTGGQQIEGAASYDLVQIGDAVDVKSDGANWWLF